MAKIKIEFCWHCSHDVLLEPVYDFAGRLRYIEENKPEGEQELRKRLFKEVKGKLPDEVIKAGKAYIEAREAYDEAREAYVKAWYAYVKAGKAYVKARYAYDKAGKARGEAADAYVKAVEDNMAEILKLHAEECAGCPWDGKTIFPEKEKIMQNPDGSMTPITATKFEELLAGGKNACRVGDVFKIRRCYFELETISNYGISAKGISKIEYLSKKKSQRF